MARIRNLEMTWKPGTAKVSKTDQKGFVRRFRADNLTVDGESVANDEKMLTGMTWGAWEEMGPEAAMAAFKAGKVTLPFVTRGRGNSEEIDEEDLF